MHDFVVVHAEEVDRLVTGFQVSGVDEAPVREFPGVGEKVGGVLAVEHGACENAVCYGIEQARSFCVLWRFRDNAEDVQCHRNVGVDPGDGSPERLDGEAMGKVEVMCRDERILVACATWCKCSAAVSGEGARRPSRTSPWNSP